MVPCYFSAYVPVLTSTISLVLLFVHGGLLFHWRSNGHSSSYFLSRTYSLSLLFTNLATLLLAVTVAALITDGLRQTCLSFTLISDMNLRPTSCQNGYDSKDLNYDIEWTYYYICLAITGAWISVVSSAVTFTMYFIRAGICRCSFF